MKHLLSLLLALVVTLASATLTPTQEQRARRIGDNLRCPVCSAVPITQSPSELSQNMMREVREQVAAGRSDQEVYTYFSTRFGESVLLDPPRRGVNLVLWSVPLLALVIGAVLLVRYLRAASVGRTAEGLDRDLLARVERDLRKDAP